MKFEPIRDFRSFQKELRKVVYPQEASEAVSIFYEWEIARNEDGTVSDAANDVLRLARMLKNNAKITDVSEELALLHRGKMNPYDDHVKFTTVALAFFVPRGVAVVRDCYELIGFEPSDEYEENLVMSEEKGIKYAKEIEAGKVK